LNDFASLIEFQPQSSNGLGPVSQRTGRLNGEGGPEWRNIGVGAFLGDDEVGLFTAYHQTQDIFKRYTNDPSTRWDLTIARPYVVQFAESCFPDITYIYTYHTITFDVLGAVSGYAGDGSGITVLMHRADTNEHVLSLTTAVGGTFSSTWHDDTIELYAQAREDATHMGRSDNALAE